MTTITTITTTTNVQKACVSLLKKSTTKNNNRDVEKDPNGSAEKGPEVIAQTQRAVVKAAVPLLYTVLS